MPVVARLLSTVGAQQVIPVHKSVHRAIGSLAVGRYAAR
jgi:hypothetical protein